MNPTMIGFKYSFARQQRSKEGVAKLKSALLWHIQHSNLDPVES
jgi:hypothetical protein